MRYHRWPDALGVLSRRDFLARLGAAGAGVAVAGVSACGGSGGGDGGGIVEPPATGSIAGIVETLDVGIARPRMLDEVRTQERYIQLRAYLSGRMRELVLSDPQSDFYRAPD